MEKRIGVIAVFITDKTNISEVNSLLSEYSYLILARQGLPFRERNTSIISLIVEGSANQINDLSGKLGKLKGLNVRPLFAKMCNE